MKNCVELQHKINQAVSSAEKFLFAINYEMDESLFILHPEESQEVLWRVGDVSNFEASAGSTAVDLSPRLLNKEEYAEKFRTILSGIDYGNSFLANLTIKTPLEGELSLREIATSAKSRYLLYLPDRFVCFSPEPFITIDRHGAIASYPMKGTIDAKTPHAKQRLLSDPKEHAEHCTIVDLIRSDLSRVATDVRVESFGYIEQIVTRNRTILQMSSKIEGQLLPEYRVNYGDMLLELLPAGSISGAPKPTTLQLIAEAEGQRRGFYCGVFGYYDGEELECAVMIRYIERENGQLYYRSGGGITINSNLESEYEEVNAKIYTTK